MIAELRRYTLHPGRRDELIELFHRELVAPQEEAGMRILGTFTDLDDPDAFVWLRSFPDMDARAAALAAFYDGPVWAAHKDAANATMADSDDVRLLRPAGPAVATVPDTAFVAITVLPHEEPRLGPPAYRTEHSPNTFPRLPVREGEDVFVWLTGSDDEPARVRHADGLAFRLRPTAAGRP